MNYRSQVRLPAGALPGSLDQLSLQIPAYWLGLRQGAFTCVRWQVILCDPITQLMPRSLRTGILSRALFGFDL